MKQNIMTKLIAVLILILLGFTQAQHDSSNHSTHNHSNTSQDNSFEKREQTVMPFDLETSLHIFQDTAVGGIQQVIVKDQNDQENLNLIRTHLAKEAEMFAQGLFVDPSYLHGDDMPGLSTLKQAGKEGLLKVEYSELFNGAQISYSSENLEVVIALHLWFQAQVLDHGEHATIAN